MKLEFQKTQHLRRNSDFLKVYASGKRTNDPNFSLVVLAKTHEGPCRLGLSVSRKVGKANIRNRLKRRVRELFRLNQACFSEGSDLVVVARSAAAKLKFQPLAECFLNVCRRAGVYRPVA